MSIRIIPPAPAPIFRKGTSREPRSSPAPRNQQHLQVLNAEDGDHNA